MAQRKGQKKKSKAKRKTKKQQQQQERLNYRIVGFVLILFGLFGILKLGFLGTMAANGFRMIVGNTYPALAVLIMLYGSYLLVQAKELKLKKKRPIGGGILLYLGILLFLHAQMFGKVMNDAPNVLKTTWQILLQDIKRGTVEQSVGGGMVGGALYSGTYFLVSQFGSYLLAVLLIVVGGFLLSMIDYHRVTDVINAAIEKVKDWLTLSQEKQTERSARRAEKQRVKQEQARELAEEKRRNSVRPLTPGEELAQTERDLDDFEEPEQLSFVPINSYQENLENVPAAPEARMSESSADHLAEAEEDLEFQIKEEAEDRDYQLPPTTLLDSIPATDQSNEHEKIKRNIGVLEQTFKSFGVDAKVVKASLGPAVTKFEVQPAVGVKVSKVVGLTDDIALALAAKDVRMEAPIPGKSLIGIEVPNSQISTVSFRDIVESQPQHADKLLEVPLGRDISGQVQTADLTKMPHLLIAGSTGSGKSVCINGIITSILMQAKPHEVKLMMIDPKMVELNVYNGIPHLLTPVVTNPRKASQALHKVVQEMERRYELFAASGVRNITGYNDLVIRKNLEDGDNRPILPFIVVIVDELADLMMVASNEVEDAIIRLAQMARAAGIHMILATQRPSVDVITGIIKANVPSRIAFAVSSGTDSRTIIDSNGAEKLLGRGDMLFLPMGENKPIRVQGAFISDQEVERIVAFVTDQQEADYQEDMMPSEEPEATNSHEVPQDELFDEAKALVVEMQTASISLLQRRFRIGYNRAARLVDELEDKGVIGPSEGSKPRKVFITHVPDEEQVQE